MSFKSSHDEKKEIPNQVIHEMINLIIDEQRCGQKDGENKDLETLYKLHYQI